MKALSVSFDQATLSGTSTQYLREKLDKAESLTETKEAFQELFCKKIESMMKVSAASIKVNRPLSDLGLDSLLATEIGTWLLRDTDFEMPLLTFMGRDLISSIYLDAARIRVEARGTIIEDKPTTNRTEGYTGGSKR